MASLQRTMQRSQRSAQHRGQYQRGKRTPRAHIASMLTGVDWPVFVVYAAGKSYDERVYRDAFEQRCEAWLNEFRAERASYRHAPNIERWLPQMVAASAQNINLPNAA
jgi:hypothetical protein